MIDIDFVVGISNQGSLDATIKDLEKALQLQKDFGTTTSATIKKVIADYNAYIAKIAELQKKLQGANDTKQLGALTGELEKQKKALDGINTEATKLNETRKKSKILTDEELKDQIQLNEAQNRRKKNIREAIKDQQAMEIAMKKEVKSIRDLKEQTNALVRLRDKMTVSNKKQQREFDDLTRKIATNETQLKKYDSAIGRSQRNVGNYTGALRGFGRQLLAVAGVAGGVQIFRNAIEQIGDFEQSFADLQTILGSGITEQTYEDLRKGAIEWGKDSTASATDILEAYKLIGSAKPELLTNIDLLEKTTKAALTLSDASGLALPEAATRLTDALNQFNLSGAESDRVINVLAAGAKAGSAEIPQITDALLEFGVVAKNFNVSIEESTGLIESFAERGIKGAEAGTALRNVLLKMQTAKALPRKALDELRKAGVDLNILSNAAIPLKDRIEELSKIQGNATAIAKVFGIENAVAGNILLDNRKHAEAFTNAVTGTNVAQEQAAKRTDTLQGELKKLANAWQSAILEFGNGSGVLKDVVKFIRENLETILNVIINVTQAFIAYKVAVGAVNLAYRAKDIVSWIINQGKVRTALKLSAKAQLELNRAMKANVIGLVIAGIVTLVDQLDLFKTAADRAAEAQEEVNQALSDFDAAVDKAIQGYKDLINEAENTARREMEIARAKGEDVSKIEEALRDKKIDIIRDGQREQNKSEGEAFNNATDLQKKRLQLLSELAVETNEFEEAKLTVQLESTEKLLKIEIGKFNRLKQAAKDFRNDEKDLNTEGTVAEIEEGKKVVAESEKQRKEREKRAEEFFQLRMDMLERERMLREIDINTNVKDEEKANDLKMQSDLKFLEDRKALEAQFGKDTVKSRLDIVVQENSINKKREENFKKHVDAIIDAQQQIDELEIAAIKDNQTREEAELQKEIEDKLAAIKVGGEEGAALEAALLTELLNKLRGIREKYAKEDFEKGIDAIERYYKEVELNTLESGQTQEQIEDELQRNEINRLEELIAERKSNGEDVIELELELARKRNDIKNKEAEEDKKRQEDFLKNTIEFAKGITSALEDELQKREERAQNEVDKQKERADAQRALAEQGLANTLAFEDELLAEKEKRLLEEQKKQEKLKLIESFFNALAEYSKDDPNTAPAKALAQTFIAKAIAAKLEEGGVLKDEVKAQGGSLGSDGVFKGQSHKQGGIKVPLAEFEGEEGVLSKKEMRKLGRSNFYNLKKSLKGNRANEIFKQQSDESIALIQHKEFVLNTKPIENKLDELKRAIDEKPVPSFQMDGLGNIIEKQVTKSMKKYKINPHNR